MTNLLCRLFIKNRDNLSNPAVRKNYGTLASIVGIGMNILLSAIKLAIGVITASMAITADALNNLSDAGASGISLISFKLSAKPADREHPFGHARFEYVASMIVSFLILLVGAELFTDSISSIFSDTSEDPLVFSTVSLVILGISILGKLWLAVFYRKIGKKIDSGVLIAASTDSLTDCISTAAVLASSVIIKLTDVKIIDSIVGLAVSLLIIIAGIRILNETKNSLLGEAPVGETVEGIKKIISEEPAILGIHDLLVHNYGPGKYIASFHAEVDGKENIYELHDKIDNLERKIEEELNILCTIHLDPIVTDDETVIALKEKLLEKVRALYPTVGVHDFRTVVGPLNTNLIFDLEVPFEIKEPADIIINSITNAVKSENPNYYCVIKIDRC